MKKISAILISIMLCVVTLLFSGCGSVRSMVVSNTDGTIDELVQIELDENEIDTAELQGLKDNIYQDGTNIVKQLIEDFIRKMQVRYNTAETEEEKTRFLTAANGIRMIKSDWSQNSFAIGIKYLNFDVYRLFYGIENEESQPPEEEKHFFYSTVYFNGYSKFFQYSILHKDLYDYLKNKYSAISQDNGQLLYTYISDFRREKSNADYVQKIGNQYYHTWIIEDVNEPISIYYNTLNRGNVILVVILFSLAVCAVLNIIVFVRRKKTKVENLEN